MRIQVQSHTDSRGNPWYNRQLSQKRAEATQNWIVSQGIDKQRITSKGYGDTQLLNGCKANVDCSELQHQENRRSAFIIVDL